MYRENLVLWEIKILRYVLVSIKNCSFRCTNAIEFHTVFTKGI